MNEEQIKKYNELLKKHEILTKRYADLEKLEEKLNSDKTMSGEKRLENLINYPEIERTNINSMMKSPIN